MRALARALAIGRNPFRNPLETFSDLELVAGMNSGDQKCFEVFYNRHKAGLYFFIFRMVGREDVSEEILQDTFLKFFGAIARYDHKQSQVRTWLFNIARNCAIDSLRKKSEVVLEEENLEILSLEEVDSEQEAALLESAQRDELQAAITRLPVSQREAILLWMQEFSYEEMAQMSGKSVQAMKNLINRARAKLIDELKGSFK